MLRDDDSEYDSEQDQKIEEERRLLFVGITRAKKKLYLTHTRFRQRFGQTHPATPSPFLRELTGSDDENADHIDMDEETRKSLRGSIQEDLSEHLFNEIFQDDDDAENEKDRYVIGTIVEHKEWGEGEVVRTNGIGKGQRITIRFKEKEVGEKAYVIAKAKDDLDIKIQPTEDHQDEFYPL